MSRSVNFAVVVGNLTRDPEMRYTPQGHAVTSFSVATNRSWTSDGNRQEATEFHNIVAWNKLAELCSQLLQKGTKVYVKGRLQTRTWDDDKGVRHYKTEIVADDMVVLERKREGTEYVDEDTFVKEQPKESEGVAVEDITAAEEGKEEKSGKKNSGSSKASDEKEDVAPEDIPF